MGEFWEQHNAKIIEVQSTLVVRALQSCPDLMRWYLREVTEDFADLRLTDAWLALSNLIEQVLEAQNLELILNPKEKFSVKQQVQRASTLIIPPVFNQAFFINALNFDGLKVKLTACRILQIVLRKTETFLNMLQLSPKADMYSKAEKDSISSSFKGGEKSHSLSEFWILISVLSQTSLPN